MNPEPSADGSGLHDSPEVHVILDNLNTQKPKNDRRPKRQGGQLPDLSARPSPTTPSVSAIQPSILRSRSVEHIGAGKQDANQRQQFAEKRNEVPVPILIRSRPDSVMFTLKMRFAADC
jgi:hypothetical protein